MRRSVKLRPVKGGTMIDMKKILSEILFTRLGDEQRMYHRWLCMLTSDLAMKYADEFITRENILRALRGQTLSEKQADALLRLRDPMDYQYQAVKKRDEENPWRCYLEMIKDTADQLVQTEQSVRDREE